MKTTQAKKQSSLSKLWRRFGSVAVLFATALAISTGAQAQQPPFGPPIENVPGITLNNLGTVQGKYLTVLYVNGWAPGILTDARQLIIREIKQVVTVQVTSPEIALAPTQLQIIGAFSMSHVVFVYHDQPVFTWRNADNSALNDPRGIVVTPETSVSLFARLLSKLDIERLVAEQGNPQQITVPLK